MRNNDFYVYKHTSPSGKVYIGITSQKPHRRWRDDGSGYKNNKYFTNAIKKYGWDNFTHEILYTGLSKENAQEIEIKLIKHYESNKKDKGYNIGAGGEGFNGMVFSDEMRKKWSEAHKGKKLSEETKEKIRKAQTWQQGEGHPMYGKHLSKETKQKIGQANSTPVKCIELNKIYPSMLEASKQTGIDKTSISSCCRGKTKTAGKLHWEYVV